jgi:hypothetical protein
MGSVLAWLDHDEAGRRRMQEAIALLRERDTVDELGIGSARDAFSNLLFPGTSVLHTRARYLLFVPWIYRRLERALVGTSGVAAASPRDEVRLIGALLAGGEELGVIGGRARADLKLMPSEMYWSGLGTLGLRRFAGTGAQYHRTFDAFRDAAHGRPRLPLLSPRWSERLPVADPGATADGQDGDRLERLGVRVGQAERLVRRDHEGIAGTDLVPCTVERGDGSPRQGDDHLLAVQRVLRRGRPGSQSHPPDTRLPRTPTGRRETGEHRVRRVGQREGGGCRRGDQWHREHLQ